MNKGALRTIWRRRVRDTASVEWQDSEADQILNDAYAWVQKEILKVARDSHLSWDTIPTTAGIDAYPLPPTFGIRWLGIKSKSTDTNWTKLEPKEWSKIQEFVMPVGAVSQVALTKSYYSVMGQYIVITPIPSVSISDGIRLIHDPIMSMSSNDDLDEPRIKTPLHVAIVEKATLIALGDTDETSVQAKERLAELMQDLGQWYNEHSENDDKFVVQGLVHPPGSRVLRFNDVNP